MHHETMIAIRERMIVVEGRIEHWRTEEVDLCEQIAKLKRRLVELQAARAENERKLADLVADLSRAGGD